MKPDGIFLSNGPGDPAAVGVAIRNIAALAGKIPIFGICLGHQLLALALGGKTYKLKFGHRGGNHPVKNLLTGKIEITSQNHGFAVDPASLDPSAVEITHVNLYDQTNEGFRHRKLPIFSVQYHPEASPGPHDSDYLFAEFITMMKSGAPARSSLAGAAGNSLRHGIRLSETSPVLRPVAEKLRERLQLPYFPAAPLVRPRAQGHRQDDG